MPRKLWTREEMILTLSLYFQLPFGRLNHSTPEVKELAALIGRTNNSVALRLVNYAACDPYILNSGRHGMASGAKTCKPYWDEFSSNKEKLFLEAQKIKANLLQLPIEQTLHIAEKDLQGVDRLALVKQRINQSVFRTLVLNNYENRCAITGISIPDFLVASHIIPWAENEAERLNPENGICLSSLYDKAFDRGFIGIDNHYRIILAPKLKVYRAKPFYAEHFAKIEHQELSTPIEYKPNLQFLEWHRDCVFNK